MSEFADDLLDSAMLERALKLEARTAEQRAHARRELTVKLPRRAIRELAALRIALQCGNGQIVARAIAELASRHLGQKKRKR